MYNIEIKSFEKTDNYCSFRFKKPKGVITVSDIMPDVFDIVKTYAKKGHLLSHPKRFSSVAINEFNSPTEWFRSICSSCRKEVCFRISLRQDNTVIVYFYGLTCSNKCQNKVLQPTKKLSPKMEKIRTMIENKPVIRKRIVKRTPIKEKIKDISLETLN